MAHARHTVKWPRGAGRAPKGPCSELPNQADEGTAKPEPARAELATTAPTVPEAAVATTVSPAAGIARFDAATSG